MRTIQYDPIENERYVRINSNRFRQRFQTIVYQLPEMRGFKTIQRVEGGIRFIVSYLDIFFISHFFLFGFSFNEKILLKKKMVVTISTLAVSNQSPQLTWDTHRIVREKKKKKMFLWNRLVACYIESRLVTRCCTSAVFSLLNFHEMQLNGFSSCRVCSPPFVREPKIKS